MLIFQLFEIVTGRISLAKSQSIEAELKEACAAEGATYNKAAKWFSVTGSMAQLDTVKKHINKNDMSSSERSISSSSEHNEKSALPSFQRTTMILSHTWPHISRHFTMKISRK